MLSFDCAFLLRRNDYAKGKNSSSRESLYSVSSDASCQLCKSIFYLKKIVPSRRFFVVDDLHGAVLAEVEEEFIK